MTISSVSVVICTWNRRKLLAETLDTLRKQRLDRDCQVEVLVVDNNSNDDTEGTVREYQSGWPVGTLKYLREERQGKQFALNRAVRNATGEVLAFTDDDVIIPEDWLASVVKLFDDPDVELAGGKTQLVWPGGKAPQWFRNTMNAVLGGVDLGDSRLLAHELPEDYAPAGSNLIARRSLFNRVGLYSETHFRHMDYEFGIRARQSGAAVVYDPHMVIFAPVPEVVINKHYFRRWYFKLGIASAMHSTDRSARLLGVPRWIWRQAASDGVVALAGRIRGGKNEVFEREIRFLQNFGHLCAVWHRKLRPAHHDQWVQRWSQKRGATFG